jgi:hypothetical protein
MAACYTGSGYDRDEMIGEALIALALVGVPQVLPSVQLEPPARFALQLDLPIRETAALAPVVGDRADPPRRLEAYFIEDVDGGPGEGATLSVSSVDAPLSLDSFPSPIIASAAMAHLRRQLDIEASLDRVATRERSGSAASARVEVWARARLDGAPTTLLLAFFPGPESYVVAVAAMPALRAAELTPRLEASLDSFVLRPRLSRFAPTRWLSVLVWGAAGLILVSWRVLRGQRD